MNSLFLRAQQLLKNWKADKYVFGRGVLPRLGKLTAKFGKKPLAVCNEMHQKPITEALEQVGITLAASALIPGARPNAPCDDVFRIAATIRQRKPAVLIAIGGASTIDACKAAKLLAALEQDSSFQDADTELIAAAVAEQKGTNKKLIPLIAVQTAAGSGSHLTKYAAILGPGSDQIKLFADNALVPNAALFDYDVSVDMPLSETIDGALDTLAHCFETFAGSSEAKYSLAAAIAECAVELIVQYTPALIKDPSDMNAREALGLASDLGGYATMAGSTNAAHLNSRSLAALAGHGTVCGILNPSYAVFFAPAIPRQLKTIGSIFRRYGYIKKTQAEFEALTGSDLGLAVASGLVAFNKAIGAPATLGELPLWNDQYIEKILNAAKDPTQHRELKHMPIPLSVSDVDLYMGPIIKAAVSGDFSRIKPHA
ncbi:iron-containing alcohol dehydrogenase [Breznakiellaceae bacterium SP9]